MTMIEYLLAAAGSCLLLLLGTIAWFIRSGFTRNDQSNLRVETKVDQLTATTTQLALSQGAAISELNMRVHALEQESQTVKTWREDLVGFLRDLGFRKRDGAVGAPDPRPKE